MDKEEIEPEVLVCAADVAAFVDAVETVGYPVEIQKFEEQNNVEESEESNEVAYHLDGEEEEEEEEEEVEEMYIIEEGNIEGATSIFNASTKRIRTNPKKEKETIEDLFKQNKAAVVEKPFTNPRGNRRYKSEVWTRFGDIKLMISCSEAKKLEIPYYFRMHGKERLMLSSMFVGCFRCNALFIHNSQRSGTSTLRAHIRVCSRPRARRNKGAPNIVFLPSEEPPAEIHRPVTEEDRTQAQQRILDFVLGTKSSFDVVEDENFKKMLQMCMSIGANFGNVNVSDILSSFNALSVNDSS